MTHSTDASVSKTVRSPRIRPTFFHSADRGLHVPTRLTRRPTKHEGLQPRAGVRPRVGCCEELGGGSSTHQPGATFAYVIDALKALWTTIKKSRKWRS